MMVNGVMIAKMDMVQKHGMMDLNIKEIINWAKKKDMGNIIGLMEVYIKVIGLIIIMKDMENMFGLIENIMKDFLKAML